jgi:hypothetical protein
MLFRQDAPRAVRCFAEGRDGQWEAVCLDFDLSVQGGSFTDVYARLNDQIALYLEEVASLPMAERRRFWRRKVPFTVALVMLAKMARLAIAAPRGRAVHEYSMPLPTLTLVA